MRWTRNKLFLQRYFFIWEKFESVAAIFHAISVSHIPVSKMWIPFAHIEHNNKNIRIILLTIE